MFTILIGLNLQTNGVKSPETPVRERHQIRIQRTA